MLNSLQQTGKKIGQEIGRAWESLSEGWRELLSRGGESLTHFGRAKDEARPDSASPASFPRWSLLAGEVEETADAIVVRVEAPGMDKDDCRITVEGNLLLLSGEKRFERETRNSTYHVMERAYGAFQRAIPLPRNVSVDKAKASFRNGVLTVHLPKEGSSPSRSIKVS